MAKRKKQSNGEGTILTVAFILSVMTSIGAFVWVAVLFGERNSFQNDVNTAENTARAAKIEAASEKYISLTVQPFVGAEDVDRDQWLDTETLRNDIAADIKAKADNLETNFKAFQQSYPGLVPNGAEVNYVTVAKALTDRNQTLLNDKKQLQAQVEALNKQMIALRDSQRTDTATQFTDTQAKITTAVEDLATFRADRQTASAGIDAAKQKHTQALAAKDQEIANRNNQIADAEKRLDDQAENNLVAQLKARPKSERFEIPDGKITSINEASGTVWINVGSSDDLKPLTTFSVYPKTQLGVMRGPEDIKGRIEVLKIIDGDFAECRIVEDSINDPILLGDQIYSPLWQRGISVHFALVGFFDIDGDGKSDRDRVKNIIRSAGGVIDAELSIDNTQEVDAANLIRKGGITVDTQYLVRGKTDAILNVDRQTYNRFETRAKDYNIESITINTLLNYAGYKNVKSSTGLGSGFDNENPEPLVKPVLKPEDKRNQLRFPPRRSENGGAF
ncbi:MAG: hypothetical protein ACJZ8Y_08075 [Pirellulaceae bacterium]|nr:hypothetical protein [Pirellulaceae bacterium]